MPRFPGYNPQFQYYRPYNYKPCTPVQRPVPYSESFSHPQTTPPPPPTPPKNTTKSVEPVWLDLFGIKLYFDDVLILSLLFFLYKEEVKDEGLFLALVLLLIS